MEKFVRAPEKNELNNERNRHRKQVLGYLSDGIRPFAPKSPPFVQREMQCHRGHIGDQKRDRWGEPAREQPI